MRRSLVVLASVAVVLLLLANSVGATSDHTIAINGTNDFDSGTENLGAESSRTGYLTWDSTNLYIGIEGNPLVGTNSNLYVVVDATAISNADPRTGAGRTDQPTTESGGATYPVGADIVYLFYGTGSDDGSVQNPAPGLKYTVSGGNWTSASIASGARIIRKSSSITELEIPFSQLGISSGGDFNILFYIANNSSGGSNFAQWPTGNANGNNPTLRDFYTYTWKSGIAPNAGRHYSYREDSITGYTIGGATFGSIFFVPPSLTTYNAGSLTTLGYHLYIGSNAIFSMSSGGSLSIAGNWTKDGTFTHNNSTVTFNGASEQTIGGSQRTDFGTLTISSGATVVAPAGSTQPRANTVNNNGTLKQTDTVGVSATVNFLKIRNTADNADTYRGIDIANGGAALGSTTVYVSGNRPLTNTCPDIASGSRPVRRCYLIDVATSNSTSATFYYTYAELRTDLGQSAANLKVWNNTSGTTWTMLASTPNATCGSGQLDCSVQATSFTPTRIDGAVSPESTTDDYVLMASNPQAVTLADFSAAQQGDAVLLTWETNSELENRGFNLYRGTSAAGPDRQLNETLIPSQSQGNPGGFVYTWEDRAGLVPGTTYFYWVEDVDLNGTATMHGPVSVDFAVPTAVTLNGVQAGGAAVQPLPWLWVAVFAGLALALSRFSRRPGRQNA